MKPIKHLTLIEPLEARIAPAIILNPYTVTYQDGSGDTAVVKISKPLFKNSLAAGKILNFTDTSGNTIQESFSGNGTAENLGEINLLGRTDASGMNISVTVLPQVGVGDLQVNVGEILAANFQSGTFQVTQNISLGSIDIQGDLGLIDAGASNYYFVPAIKSLTVKSMNEGDQSYVLGPIGSLTVQDNFSANLAVIGYQFGSIGKLYIGGSLTGDASADNGSGVIQFYGHIGSAVIGSITGTAGNYTGYLEGVSSTGTTIGSLTVLNSITGGSGNGSGDVTAEYGISHIYVGGDIHGGAGQASGQISGPLGAVDIAGSLIGNSGLGSGSLFSQLAISGQNPFPVGIGKVTIGGNVQGGEAGVAAAGSTAAQAGESGVISALSAPSITIGGSLIGGNAGTDSNASNETANTSGAILVNSVQNLTILGGIQGGTGPSSGIVTTQSSSGSSHYGNVFISGDIKGGTGAVSGAVYLQGGGSGTSIANLRLSGNVIGGAADNSGEIFTNGALTKALITGNITGNSTTTTAAVYNTGYLQAGSIGALDIKGTIVPGSDTGGIVNSGAIRATTNITSLTVEGAITATAANPVIISALQGPATKGKPTTDLAISNLSFLGAVSGLDVLAGYTTPVVTIFGATSVGAALGIASDATAQIGTVTFHGNLSASNVVAGVTGVSGTGYLPGGHFGTAGDAAITSGGTSGLYSTIGKIILEGSVTADSTTGDSFGFVAQDVKSVALGTPPNATYISLDPGPNNDHLVTVSGNLVVNEVPPA